MAEIGPVQTHPVANSQEVKVAMSLVQVEATDVGPKVMYPELAELLNIMNPLRFGLATAMTTETKRTLVPVVVTELEDCLETNAPVLVASLPVFVAIEEIPEVLVETLARLLIIDARPATNVAVLVTMDAVEVAMLASEVASAAALVAMAAVLVLIPAVFGSGVK